MAAPSSTEYLERVESGSMADNLLKGLDLGRLLELSSDRGGRTDAGGHQGEAQGDMRIRVRRKKRSPQEQRARTAAAAAGAPALNAEAALTTNSMMLLGTAKPIYPYDQLAHNHVTYRGYPVEGPEVFKKSKKWKIQIVSSHCKAPPEPLPQFPQQEVLSRGTRANTDEYVGLPPWSLSPAEVGYNSGESYIKPGASRPSSEYFYTAGYSPNSAVKLQKPFTGSIYHYFVEGHSVPVKIIKEKQ